MAWLAVDEDGREIISLEKPIRHLGYNIWVDEWNYEHTFSMGIPKGSIAKLIGRELTWEDEPVELKEE